MARRHILTGLVQTGLIIGATLILSGCAHTGNNRFAENLDTLTTMGQALAVYGPAAHSEDLAEGGRRLEWRLHEQVSVPGQYVYRTYYVGRDRDGYPREITRRIWQPEQRLYYQCDLVLIGDGNDLITDRRWQGNACDRLMPGRITW